MVTFHLEHRVQFSAMYFQNNIHKTWYAPKRKPERGHAHTREARNHKSSKEKFMGNNKCPQTYKGQ
jgi:hypothetical protein